VLTVQDIGSLMCMSGAATESASRAVTGDTSVRMLHYRSQPSETTARMLIEIPRGRSARLLQQPHLYILKKVVTKMTE
jgi:hypothetical protein